MNHNEGKQDWGMMIMMMFCCLALPLLFTYFASNNFLNGNSIVNVAIMIVIFFAVHYIVMRMFCGHHSPDAKNNGAETDDKNHNSESCH